MHSRPTAFLLALALAGRSAAADVPGVVRLPLTRTTASSAQLDSGLRRRDAIGATLGPLQDNNYVIELSVGTPPQNVKLIFDMGSNNLWVNPNCGNAPCFAEESCRAGGHFDETKSSTFSAWEDLPMGHLEYETGDANVTWSRESIAIGDTMVKEQIFGLAQNSTVAPLGIFGAAPSFQLQHVNPGYMQFIDSLQRDGHIKRSAFGLDIRTDEKNNGAVVFGGVDVAKFSGRLEWRSMVSVTDDFDPYVVTLEGIATREPNGTAVDHYNDKEPLLVMLDNGSDMSILPQSIIERIVGGLPGAELRTMNMSSFNTCGNVKVRPERKEQRLFYVDCTVRNFKATLDFVFGNTTIALPFKDAFFPPEGNDTKCGMSFYVGKQKRFGMLGSNVLNRAYMVADWKGKAVYLANSADCGSEIVALDDSTNIGTITGRCEPALPTAPAGSTVGAKPCERSA